MAGGFEFTGLNAFSGSIDKLIEAVNIATRDAVVKGALVIENAAKMSMNDPGPKVRSGRLRRSIRMIDTVEIGKGVWQSRVAPTTVYGRRMELGFHGIDSLGRNYTNPGQRAYPFLKPGLDKSLSVLPKVFEASWATALIK